MVISDSSFWRIMRKVRWIMGDFWQLFKEGWKNEWERWERMGNSGSPPQNSGTGRSGTGGSNSASGDDPRKEWELVYQKFREIKGRDPYSFQEVIDWWNMVYRWINARRFLVFECSLEIAF